MMNDSGRCRSSAVSKVLCKIAFAWQNRRLYTISMLAVVWPLVLPGPILLGREKLFLSLVCLLSSILGAFCIETWVSRRQMHKRKLVLLLALAIAIVVMHYISFRGTEIFSQGLEIAYALSLIGLSIVFGGISAIVEVLIRNKLKASSAKDSRPRGS